MKLPTVSRWHKRALQLAFLLLFSGVFVLCFSYSTSFLYPGYYGSDSAIFQLIGKYWAQGVVPYKQLFDHKGPLIFFIDAIGYAIHGRSGILVLQTLSLAVTIGAFYRFCRLGMGWLPAGVSTAVSLLYLARSFDEGNMTEEYSLPFLAICLYLAGRWYLRQTKGDVPCHPWQYAAVYGGCFAAVVMLRLTNAILIGSLVLVIVILLIVCRQWRNLWHNALGFLGGFGVCFLPFVAYFAANGALGDMLYGTIGYNIFYATEFSITDYYANNQWADSTIRRVLFDFGAPLFLLLAVSVLALIANRKNLLAWAGLVASPISMYVLFTNRPYVHYFMIVTPLFPLIALLTVQLWQQRRAAAFLRVAPSVLCAVWFVSLCLRLPIWKVDNFVVHYPTDIGVYNAAAQTAASQIPPSQRDSVLGYNVEAQWYLINDIQPCQRYFIHQDWQSAVDETMQEEIAQDLTEHPPAWLVVSQPSNPAVQQLLQQQYTPVLGEEQGYTDYTLYHRNN